MPISCLHRQLYKVCFTLECAVYPTLRHIGGLWNEVFFYFNTIAITYPKPASNVQIFHWILTSRTFSCNSRLMLWSTKYNVGDYFLIWSKPVKDKAMRWMGLPLKGINFSPRRRLCFENVDVVSINTCCNVSKRMLVHVVILCT